LSTAATFKEACTTGENEDKNLTLNSVEVDNSSTQILNEIEKDLTANVTHDENIARTLSKGLEKKLSLIE
jgi:hypothetical protein